MAELDFRDEIWRSTERARNAAESQTFEKRSPIKFILEQCFQSHRLRHLAYLFFAIKPLLPSAIKNKKCRKGGKGALMSLTAAAAAATVISPTIEWQLLDEIVISRI